MRRTVLQLLKEAAQKYSTATYLCDKTAQGWVPKSYKKVDEESDFVASGLLNYGFAAKTKMAILAEGRSNWVISEYGILKTASVAVPLSIKLLPEEILFRLNHSEARAIFVSKNTLAKIEPILPKLTRQELRIIFLDSKSDFETLNTDLAETDLIFYEDLIASGINNYSENQSRLQEIASNIEEHDIVTISYTSGTTGNPKGIMLSHLNYYSNSKNAWAYFQLPEYMKTLIVLPLDHSFAHTVGTFISCVCALSIYFVDGRGGPTQALKNIPVNLKEVQPDFLLTVPSLTGNFMNKIKEGVAQKGKFVNWLFHIGLQAGIRKYRDGYRYAPFFLRMFYSIPHFLADKLVFKKVRAIFGGRLQFCIGGGALLDIKQQHFFYALKAPVYQGYGLTEATPIISTNSIDAHKLGTSGRVINGIECIILDENGKPLSRGEKGEIVIRGNNVMEGYYKNQAATEESIKEGWLHTGDRGYYDQDDFLVVVGREKALLIAEDGEKYSPESIEEAIINASSLIYQTMVYNDHKKYTTALVTIDKGNLQAYAREQNLEDPEAILEAIRESFYQFMYDPEYEGQFPSKWIPRNFRILKEPFTEENKMINSTMKMVRPKITETYQDVIREMYDGTSPGIFSAANLEAVEYLLKN